jgi:carboxypeptidase family protein
MRLALVVALLFLSLVSAAAQSPDGAIRGTVLAEDGSPIADAHVSAEAMRGNVIQTVLDVNTDDYGIFVFAHLAMGEYRLSAEKQESGYLSTRPDIFSSRSPFLVSLTSDTPMFSTVIRFAPKAAVITGWVRDAATGASIAAHLSLAPMESNRGWSTTGTNRKFKFRLQIPANTDVKFGACSEGYRTWFYADPSNTSRAIPLKLRSGETKELNVTLEKSSDPQHSICNFGTF